MSADFRRGDAMPYLFGRYWGGDDREGSIVTSLPDAAELGLDDLDRYELWFRRAAERVLWATPVGSAAVFYQTDRRRDGGTLSKARILLDLAKRDDGLVFHKIVLRRPPGSRDLYRPTYSHLIALAPKGRVSAGRAGPDVFAPTARAYADGMDVGATLWVVRWLRETVGETRVVDPFCGLGTVPVLADAVGLDALGIDIDEEKVEQARELTPRQLYSELDELPEGVGA